MAPNKYFGISRITSITDWEELVGEKDWKPKHSAYELAQSWFRSDGLPSPVKGVLEGHAGFAKIELERAFVEYPVGLDTGKSPSMNDLMVYCRLKDELAVIAVEGKANESFDVKVEVWRRGDGAGKLRRLRFLENVLRVESEGALNECYYQLLHRTASGILEASQVGSKVSMMMIHSFSNDEKAKKKNWEAYKEFLSALGVDGAVEQNAVAGPLPLGESGNINTYFAWINDKPWKGGRSQQAN